MKMRLLYCSTLMRSSEIRPLWESTLRTRTSTRSPGPSARLRRRWLTGSLSRVILLLWMRPERPTPISTKDPNRVVLSTLPVNTVPGWRSLMDTMPRLKSGCPKSGEQKQINSDNITYLSLQNDHGDLYTFNFYITIKHRWQPEKCFVGRKRQAAEENKSWVRTHKQIWYYRQKLNTSPFY